MNRRCMVILVSLLIVLLLTSSVQAWIMTQQQTRIQQQSQSCVWDPFVGQRCSSSQSTTNIQTAGQATGMGIGMAAMNPIMMGGPLMTAWYNPMMMGPIFFANETQMADVSGTWQTDLLGPLYLKLTEDDVIRGYYMIDETDGYVEGNFTYNETPMMNGFWWESPTYQPPMSAGIMYLSFENETALSGVYSYSNGIWGPFEGMKVDLNVPDDVVLKMEDMPELNWTMNFDELKDYRVDNPAETNPVMNEQTE